MNICAIILSAGKSKRFKSSKPKFLHEISGKELIQYNLDALNKIKQVKKTFIISSKANKKYFIHEKVFIQNPIDGTGGAFKQFYKYNNKFDYFLLTLADTPIFDYKILSDFVLKGVKNNDDLSVLTQNVRNPKGYGRVVKKNNLLIFSASISYSKNTDIIHDFKITFDCKLEKIMIKNKDFNYQTFTADNIEVDKNKVLKVVAAQPSKLTINGLSEFIDTYSDISKDDVRIAKNDTILFKNIDKEKKYSESVFLNRSTGELIHEVTKNINTKDNEKYISFFGCTKEL